MRRNLSQPSAICTHTDLSISFNPELSRLLGAELVLTEAHAERAKQCITQRRISQHPVHCNHLQATHINL